MFKRVFTAVASALILSTLALSYAAPSELQAIWSPPTEGSPVEYYEFQITLGDSVIWTAHTTQATLTIPGDWREVGIQYFGRVRAYDRLDRNGPWSSSAEVPTYDPGPPGACGSVSWHEVDN